jgi:shikimate dehydrogenase
MMNAAFAATGIDAVLVPIGVPPDGLGAVVAALRAMGALGASVTVPHKLAVAALCDEVTPAARAIGAVNCLQLGARVVGHNTDAGGFADALAAAGIATTAGARVVVLGAGGAARAVVAGLTGAAVEVVARGPVAWIGAPWVDGPASVAVSLWAAVADALAGADLVVDCTPVGLDPAAEPAFVDPLPLDRLPASAVVATLVYHRRTLLLERALARGHRVLDGSDMLVFQGARAFTLWTGRDPPVDVMRRVVKAA